MTDNQIEVSSFDDIKMSKYSSDNIKKSLNLAKKLSNPDREQEGGTVSDLAKLLEMANKDLGFDISDSAKLTGKILECKFDFNDFIKQMQIMKQMGSLGGLLKKIPGMGELSDGQLKQGEDQLKKAEAMIFWMTEDERANPNLLAGSVSRQQRLAEDSGYSESDIRKFIGEFTRMRSMMQQMSMGNFPGMGGAKSDVK